MKLTVERGSLGRIMGAAVLVLFMGPVSSFADQRVTFPAVDTVQSIDFSAPGCGWRSFGGRQGVEPICAFLGMFQFEWNRDTHDTFAEFVVSMDVGKKHPFEVRAGRWGDTAILQTTAADGQVLVRAITLTDLTRLLELCKCDLTVAYLQRDRGHFGNRMDEILAQHVKSVAKDVDNAKAAMILDAMLAYSRATPQDTATSYVLRQLDLFEIRDLVPDWYAISLTGCGDHCHNNMIVSSRGEAMPATPQSCLSVCENQFGNLNKIENAKKLCAKVLEASGDGAIISDAKEIPYYDENPMPPETAKEILPMYAIRIEDGWIYGFYVYNRWGGVVSRYRLTVQNGKTTWEGREIMRGIGRARFVL